MLQAISINRRRFCTAVAGLGLALHGVHTPALAADPVQAPAKPAACGDEWPAWVAFRTQFVAPDGRVIDPDTPRAHTVSEAQAYGLFFALVGNDRPSFDKILQWTENNLCAGDMTSKLPAWIWGKRDDGNWAVVDDNSATDADLWMVYALGEAGRLWGEKRFTALSSVLADRLLREAAVDIPGLGLTLLPAPKGFQLGANRWRLNPSYYPMHLLRWLAKYQANPAWDKILLSAKKIIIESAPKGYSPDWTIYNANRQFELDLQGEEKGQGGYNAIRVYLWAGLMAPGDAHAKALLDTLAPMARLIDKSGYPPEYVNVLTGDGPKPGPGGFSAAVVPYLHAVGHKTSLAAQLNRLQAKPIRPRAYYEQSLALFGLGAHEGYFRFAADGRLVGKWKKGC